MSKRFLSPDEFPVRRDPDGKPLCRWCGGPVKSPRRSWCSQECVDAYLIRRSSGSARNAVFERDKGVCFYCGIDTEAIYKRLREHPGFMDYKWYRREHPGEAHVEAYRKELEVLGLGKRDIGAAGGHLWEAHHLVPVAEGGGGCGLEGYVTACWRCHPKETGKLRRRLNGPPESAPKQPKPMKPVAGEQLALAEAR